MYYHYKFIIDNKIILKFDKYYRLIPFRERSRPGSYSEQTTDSISFYKAIRKGRTTLTVYYICRNKVKFKVVINIIIK